MNTDWKTRHDHALIYPKGVEVGIVKLIKGGTPTTAYPTE